MELQRIFTDSLSGFVYWFPGIQTLNASGCDCKSWISICLSQLRTIRPFRMEPVYHLASYRTHSWLRWFLHALQLAGSSVRVASLHIMFIYRVLRELQHWTTEALGCWIEDKLLKQLIVLIIHL